MDSFACGRVGIATGMAGQERTQHRYLGNSPALRRLWDIRGLWDGLDQDSGGLRVERADGSVFSVASAVFGWSGRCAGVRRAGGRYGRALKGAGRLSPMRHGAGGAERLGGWLARRGGNPGIKTRLVTEAVTEQRGLSDFIVITTIMELGGYGAAGTDAISISRKLTSTSAIAGYQRVVERA